MNRILEIIDSNDLDKVVENEPGLVVIVFYGQDQTSYLGKNCVQELGAGFAQIRIVFVDLSRFKGFPRSISKQGGFIKPSGFQMEMVFQRQSLGTANSVSEEHIRKVWNVALNFIASRAGAQTNPAVQYQNKSHAPQQIPPHGLHGSHANGVPNQFQTNVMGIANAMHKPSDMTVPTLQQMNFMFRIFEILQQMGVIECKSSHSIKKEPKEIIAPNGDRIVPLENGTFGLIRKKR